MRLCVVLLWFLCFGALAQGNPVDIKAGLSGIPLNNIVIAIVLSFIGGVAYTSQREAKSESRNEKLALTISSDILVAIVAGLVTFFLMSVATESATVQAAFITLSGYGGTRIMDSYLSALIDRIKNFFTGKQAQ